MNDVKLEESTSLYLSFDSTMSGANVKLLEKNGYNLKETEKHESTIAESLSSTLVDSSVEENFESFDANINANKTIAALIPLMKDSSIMSSTPHSETNVKTQFNSQRKKTNRKSMSQMLLLDAEDNKENQVPLSDALNPMQDLMNVVSNKLTALSLNKLEKNVEKNSLTDNVRSALNEQSMLNMSENVQLESQDNLFNTDTKAALDNSDKSKCVLSSIESTTRSENCTVEVASESLIGDVKKNSGIEDNKICAPQQKKNHKIALPLIEKNQKQSKVVIKASHNMSAKKVARKSLLPTRIKTRQSIFNIDNRAFKETSKEDARDKRKTIAVFKKTPTKAFSTNTKHIRKEQLLTQQTNKRDLARKIIEKQISKKSDELYTCPICSSKFLVKALLEAHKKIHIINISNDKESQNLSTNSSAKSFINQCKYCDKKFALVHALHIHLMQNCAKIPPREKRSLQFTEMDHVEKSQLPAIFSKTNLTKGANLNRIPSVKKIVRSSDNIRAIAKDSMPPPKNPVVKKSAHSGIVCTPKKAICCNICNRKFRSVMDYTNHCLTTHLSKYNQYEPMENTT